MSNLNLKNGERIRLPVETEYLLREYERKQERRRNAAILIILVAAIAAASWIAEVVR